MVLAREDRQELDRLRQSLSRLLADPQFPDTIEALNDPATLRQAQANPEAFLRRRGLGVPDDVDVTIGEATGAEEEPTPQEFSLEVHIDWCSRRNPKFCIKIDFSLGR
jgi:hypothetical protein